jgi:hypothetical protein
MMISGPVSNAAQGGKINPWFGIVIGGTVLVTTWTKYLKGELRQGAHLGILFRHKRDLHSVYRHRAMGITALTMVPNGIG